MHISIPVRQSTLRLSDGSSIVAHELVTGFARVTTDNVADNAAFGGQHILISNPFIQWAIEMRNSGHLGSSESIFVSLTEEPPSSPGDDDNGPSLNTNDVKV